MNYSSRIIAEIPSVEQSIELMYQFHEGHDDGDYPYFYHPLRTMDNVLRLWPEADEETLIIALFHDVLEKCKKDGITAEYLFCRGYSPSTILAIENITKNEEISRPYQERIDWIIATGNWKSILVKLADNMDNRHPERNRLFALRKPEKALEFAERYDLSIEKLSCALETLVPHLGITYDRVLDLLQKPQPLPPPADNVTREIDLGLFPQIPVNSPTFD